MRRDRDELEDSLDVGFPEAGLEQPLGRLASHEPLCARAGVDPRRLDADDSAHARLRRGGDADDRDHLLRGEARDRRAALERIAGRDPNLGATRRLTGDDLAGDVLGQLFHEERLADHDLVDRLLEELREARHVHALLRGIEVDEAVDVGGDQLFGAAPAQADRLGDALHPGAREAEPHFGCRSLQVVQELP